MKMEEVTEHILSHPDLPRELQLIGWTQVGMNDLRKRINMPQNMVYD